MKVRLLAFGIAKDILAQQQLEFELNTADTSIAALRQALYQQYPRFAELRSLAFAVGDEYRQDDFRLSEHAEIVLIPPVSGG